MHELSIAMSIIGLVEDESARLGAESVEAVHLRLGDLSGVAQEALEFSYSLATAATILEGSRLVIEPVPVLVFCSTCDAARPVPSVQHLCCAVCGTPSAAVVQGRELLITGLEIRP